MPKKGKGSAKGAAAAEKEEWVAVQKRTLTFTNWMNYRLEGQVIDLETVLGDGVILIKLLEALSHKKVPGKWVTFTSIHSAMRFRWTYECS